MILGVRSKANPDTSPRSTKFRDPDGGGGYTETHRIVIDTNKYLIPGMKNLAFRNFVQKSERATVVVTAAVRVFYFSFDTGTECGSFSLVIENPR